MLEANAAEVTEAYKYEFTNSLTNMKETVTRADNINLNACLSMYLYGYIKQQFNNVADDELVAEDEPPECSMTDNTGHLTDTSANATPLVSKGKKDKDKALYKGELND